MTSVANSWFLVLVGVGCLYAVPVQAGTTRRLRQRGNAFNDWWDNFLGDLFGQNTPGTTVSPGCYHNGQYYNFGEYFGEGYDAATNWCYGNYCDQSGQVYAWDKWNCRTTNPPPTTQTPSPTPPPPGCYDGRGQYFPPGTEMSSGQTGNWCYGTFCNEYAEIMHWDDFNCGETTPLTTTMPPPTTTVPPTTTIPAIRNTTAPQGGCIANNGQHYAPGSEISRGEDPNSNWCFGSYCDQDGNIVQWDNFNCFYSSTMSPEPSTTPTTAAPTSTTTDTTPSNKQVKALLDILKRMLKMHN